MRELRNLLDMLHARAWLMNRALGTRIEVGDWLVERSRELDADAPARELLDVIDAGGDAGEPALEGADFAEGSATVWIPDDADNADERAASALLDAMCARAADARWVLRRPVRRGNERYAMRAWTTQLGLGGADHAWLRATLSRNLRGYSAFRDEVARARWDEARRARRTAPANTEPTT